MVRSFSRPDTSVLRQIKWSPPHWTAVISLMIFSNQQYHTATFINNSTIIHIRVGLGFHEGLLLLGAVAIAQWKSAVAICGMW